VVDVRYQAGRFGSGFKPHPTSDAGIREIPLAPLVVVAIRGQLPPGANLDTLVFAGPGGGNHVAAGTRTVLSRHGVRRMYQTAVKRADLDHLQLRGPHDFRHTFSTWLEDAGIPAQVIDELMGHQRSRHGDLDGGSRIGARYRHHHRPDGGPGRGRARGAAADGLECGRGGNPVWTPPQVLQGVLGASPTGGAVRGYPYDPQGRPCGRPAAALQPGNDT
jgi:hypothetical protein